MGQEVAPKRMTVKVLSLKINPASSTKTCSVLGADVTWNDTWKDTVSTSREEEKVWLVTAPGTGWPP